MPPQGEGEPFTAAQIALLKTWIDQGAVSPKDETPEDPRRHWAYQRFPYSRILSTAPRN
jgi:hypothetical protein